LREAHGFEIEMRTALLVLVILFASNGVVAQGGRPPLLSQPPEPPRAVYLLCKGAVWSHENGFGASASTPGGMTIKIDQAARQATFQTPILGEMQGELKASDESYVAHVDLAKAHAHMGRTINAVDMNVNRFTGRVSVSYVLADGAQHPAFTGECQPASPKF